MVTVTELHVNGARRRINADAERPLLFPVDLFPAVAVIVRPRKRRKLSPEQRQACSERLAGFQFRRTSGRLPAAPGRGVRRIDACRAVNRGA